MEYGMPFLMETDTLEECARGFDRMVSRQAGKIIVKIAD